MHACMHELSCTCHSSVLAVQRCIVHQCSVCIAMHLAFVSFYSTCRHDQTGWLGSGLMLTVYPLFEQTTCALLRSAKQLLLTPDIHVSLQHGSVYGKLLCLDYVIGTCSLNMRLHATRHICRPHKRVIGIGWRPAVLFYVHHVLSPEMYRAAMQVA